MYQIIEDHYRNNFSRLCKNYSRYARGLMNAEDVVQEAYKNAILYFQTYKKGEPFDQWFSIILRRALVSFNTAERNRGMNFPRDFHDDRIPVFLEDRVERIPADEQIKISLEDLGMIFKEIEQQPEKKKQILFFYFKEGWSSREISSHYGMKDGAVRQIISRFRKEFKKKVEG